MLKKIILSLSIGMSSLYSYTIDTNDIKTQLSGNTYSIDGSMSGIYKNFDTANKLWFLYMPSLNYLLIHETGKSTTSLGAQIITVSDFDSISVENDGSVSFGSYNGANINALKLENQSFNIDDSMSGIYKNFDTTNKLWFLYMEQLNYLLIHETGKSTTSLGAKIMDTSLFNSINVENGIVSFDSETNTTVEAPPSTPDLNSSSTSDEIGLPPQIPEVQ